jgi:endonuclease/exonuclease/phosphatase family metal-dependent hydrolase
MSSLLQKRRWRSGLVGSRRWRSGLVRLLRLALGLSFACALGLCLAGCHPQAESAAKDYLFCFWNTENFFDDTLDGEKREPDRACDEWFSSDKEALALKLKNLTTVLAGMNDGRGPDILALAEVENERAAELLMESLNKAVKDAPPYKHVAFRDPKGGRHIATAVLTRLPLVGNRTRLLGKRQRILETHIEVNGHDLVVLATHWTSRVSDKQGEGREHYAQQIYGRFKAMYRSNPKVDFLVCGDFNDNPDDKSVTEYLHATSDLAKVQAGGDEPLLYNLFGEWWQKNKGGKVGSHFYRGHAYVFDQIAVSPALLDKEGWTCEVDTARIYNRHDFVDKKGHPIRFGNPRDKGERGASDHFPVTVRLQVAPG